MAIEDAESRLSTDPAPATSTGSDGDPADRHGVRVVVGRTFALMAVVLGAVGMSLVAVFGGWAFLADSDALIFGALAVMFGVLTWLMIPAQSANGSVWAVAWGAVFASLYAFGLGVAVALTSRVTPGLTFSEFQAMSPSDLPTVASFFVTARFWAVVPAFWLPLTVGLLLFPNGHPPSPRWRWVGWTSIVAIAAATISTAIVQNPWSSLPISSGQDSVPGLLGSLNDAGFAVASGMALLSVTSLLVRYRRSAGVERSQIRWIAFGGGVYILALVVGGNLPETVWIDAVGGALAATALVASYGIAIMKYRLYEIDVVISKAVTYGVLAAFITGVYAVVVVGVGSVFGGGDEPNLALSITAVAIVAVAFEPLRRRVQHWANVLVYGRRATPYEVLAATTARLVDTSDPDAALAEVVQLVVDGTGASQAVLWLMVGDVMQPRAASPVEAIDALTPVVAVDPVGAIPGDRVVAIRHRGEVLGAVSITKERGDTVTGADDKVLNDVAAGAGVLIRNIALNAELAERARQLRTSRRRLVAAQDAERHRLERDLHDGAQQHVVALKLKLSIAKTLADREGADQIAAQVAALADTTQEAIDGMRLVAHGIYPPLLEADGLEAALTAARHTIPMHVHITNNGIGRHPRPIEESLYFAILGIIANAADTGATTADVTLTATHDTVGFTIHTDTTPNDLTTIEDRIDANDGTLTTNDNTITATIPTTDAADRAGGPLTSDTTIDEARVVPA